jgi:hypothetical protein
MQHACNHNMWCLSEFELGQPFPLSSGPNFDNVNAVALSSGRVLACPFVLYEVTPCMQEGALKMELLAQMSRQTGVRTAMLNLAFRPS